MIKGSLPWVALASLALAVTVAVTGRPVIPPPCLTEDGGPIPCVWDGPNRGTPGHPGYRQGDRITITERP